MRELNERETDVCYNVAEGIAWISLHNPARLNAITGTMWEKIPVAIARAQDDDEVRVVVLRGSGNSVFSAGADISEFEKSRTGEAAQCYNQLNHEAFLAVERCSKPTLAMVYGFCLGGGLGLAVSCDLRFCETGAKFSIPAARLGIGYHPRWVGAILKCVSAPHTKELLFSGERFDAVWALRTGLVNDVAQGVDLEVRTRACALTICENAPLSVRAAKRSIDALDTNRSLEDIDELERLVNACFESEDYTEGKAAFASKRKPVFKGR